MGNKLYELQHRDSGEADMVAAESFPDACELMGWGPPDVWCKAVFERVWVSKGPDELEGPPCGFEFTAREMELLRGLAEGGVESQTGPDRLTARGALLRWLMWEDLKDVV